MLASLVLALLLDTGSISLGPVLNSNLPTTRADSIITVRVIDSAGRLEIIESLTDPKDSVYIFDRKQLEQIPISGATSDRVSFSTVTKAGEPLSVSIQTATFNPATHHIDLDSVVWKERGKLRTSYSIHGNIIDGQFGYGNEGQLPTKEITQISIRWNGKTIAIPASAYSNLYEPHLHSQTRPLEIYISNDHLLCLYLAGGEGGGAYLAKLIFDSRQFITKMVVLQGESYLPVLLYDYIDGTMEQARWFKE